MSVFTIYGSSLDESTYFSNHLVKRIIEQDNSITVNMSAMSELEYALKLEDLKSQLGGSFHTHGVTHVILKDGAYFGDSKALVKYATDVYNIENPEIANTLVFSRASKEDTAKIVALFPKRQYCFLDFVDGAKKRSAKSPYYGKVIIELFFDLCPLACENFMQLCTGHKGRDPETGTILRYSGCPIHRIVKDGWFQCGDIVDGSGAHSIAAVPSTHVDPEYGKFIPDESFTADFGISIGGMVGYCNDGPHRNGSQFFITLGPCSWMNTKYVGIGRVVYGHSSLRRINEAPTFNQRPEPTILVGDCDKEMFR